MLQLNKYNCNKIDEQILIDGDLSKQVWQKSQKVKLVITSDSKTPLQATTVSALWNQDYLYVAFSCVDNDIQATMTEFNQLLYLEEVVEVFIDDDSDGFTYTEIEVNPNNAVLHYMMNNDLKGKKWAFARLEPCVHTAVKRHSSGWDVEMAIPLNEFIKAPNIPPLPGDIWRVNFYRIDRPTDGRQNEYSAWSPTGINDFHTPLSFGELVFVD